MVVIRHLERLRLRADFVRYALQDGIKLEESLGANPYKFGMIGSSDTHTALFFCG